MRRNITILALILSLTSCYEDYTLDYDYSAAYIAYQYDLRTFVVGEGMKFNFTVALGGLGVNDRDRVVTVKQNDDLLTADLSRFSEESQDETFYAIDGLLGRAPIGHLSQNYVSAEISSSGLSSVTPLPDEYYKIQGLDGLVIRKGRHTATATIKATEDYLDDAKAYKPYYALGFEIISADTDKVIKEKSFAVIAVKCESMFFGNWYYGGSSIVMDSSGKTIREDSYPIELPQSDDEVKYLKTISGYCVEMDSPYAGQIRITVKGDEVFISAVNPSVNISPIEGEPSRYNKAQLLQDRKLYLNYKVKNKNGTTTIIRDELHFRNRIRDGVNEWQDENPENYSK